MVTYLPQQSKLSRIKGSWVPQEKNEDRKTQISEL